MIPQTLVRSLLLPRKRSAMRLDSANKSAGSVVAGDNLTLTTVSTNTECNIRTNYPIPRGRWYWEAVADSVNGAVGGCGIGICNDSQVLTSPSQIGDSLNSIAWFDSNAVYRNGANVGTVRIQQNGERLGVAYDNSVPGSEEIWFQNFVAGGWNNAGADPAAGLGSSGYVCSGLNAGVFFPAATVYNNGNSYTFKFSAVDWQGAPPTGFLMLP